MSTETLRARWIEALRSGRYKQGRGRLRDGDAYCCLGVACEVSGLGTWRRHDDGRGDVYATPTGILYGWLPRGLRDELGLDENTQSKLMQLNDDEGRTFAEIADWYEENVPCDAT
jgi:hypothetical protein